MAEIVGLPPDLAVVPDAPYGPHDPLAEEKRAAFRAWRDEVLRYRIMYQDACARDPQMQVIDRELCIRSCAYFITMWGNLFEPRTDDPHRISGTFPWIPFGLQVEFWDWLDELLRTTGAGADGIVSKARDMGASWSCCAWVVWKWLFADTFTALMISRREDLVDSSTSDSLFWKIEHILGFRTGALPSWLLPKGWDWKDKSLNQQNALINPENGNELLGESTNSNAGRATRATIALLDEAPFIRELAGIWASLTNTTGHRLAVGSESLEYGPFFYNLARGIDMDAKPSAFPMEWYQNPQNDQDWYDAMKERFASEPGRFEREVERNPMGGDETYVYPMALDKVADEDAGYIEGFPLFITMDPGFDDETAIIWLQEQGTDYVVLDSYARRNQVAAFYGCILTGYTHFMETDNVRYDFPFNHRDFEIMEFTRQLPRVPIIGDRYGDNHYGASGDSVYDVLRKAPFRLKINTDRTPNGNLSANQTIVREFKGRREAMRTVLPHLVFADTPGARNVLRALQQHKFDEESGKSVTASSRPLHDWTSHYVSALEYWAATLASRRALKNLSERRMAGNQKRDARRISSKWSSPYASKLGPSPYKRKVA